MGQIACTRCGTFVDESTCFYDDDANLVCAACNDVGELESLDRRGQQVMVSSAFGSLACGFLGFCCNPAMLTTIIGLGSAISVVTGFKHQDDDWQRSHEWVRVIAILALILLLLQVAFFGLQLLGIGASLLQG